MRKTSKTKNNSNTSKKYPEKLLAIFKDMNLTIAKDRHNKLEYITITDQQKETIPFELLSDSFKTAISRKNTDTNKIYLNEMINTMLAKKKIMTTTKSNVYRLIPFFEAVGKLEVNNDTHEVYNDRKLFRAEDKFAFRLREHLKIIFPGIENKMKTQVSICTIRRTFILDICIELSENIMMGIEFDEPHHFDRDREVSDNLKRDLMSRLVELRIFKHGKDNFDNFLKALCYDIIKYTNNSVDLDEDNKTQYICNFIAYIVNKATQKRINGMNTDDINEMGENIMPPQGIKLYIDIMNEEYVDIDILGHLLLNGDCANIKKKIKKYMKNGLMTETIKDDDGNGLYLHKVDKRGNVTHLHNSELLSFIMIYDDQVSNPARILFARVIREYISILNGSYNGYSHICPAKKFINAMEDETLAYVHTHVRSFNRSTNNRKTIPINTSDEDIDSEIDANESSSESSSAATVSNGSKKKTTKKSYPKSNVRSLSKSKITHSNTESISSSESNESDESDEQDDFGETDEV